MTALAAASPAAIVASQVASRRTNEPHPMTFYNHSHEWRMHGHLPGDWRLANP